MDFYVYILDNPFSKLDQVGPLKQSDKKNIVFSQLFWWYGCDAFCTSLFSPYYSTISLPNPDFETILCKKININTFFAYKFMDEETTDGLLQGKCYGKFFEKEMLWKAIAKCVLDTCQCHEDSNNTFLQWWRGCYFFFESSHFSTLILAGAVSQSIPSIFLLRASEPLIQFLWEPRLGTEQWHWCVAVLDFCAWEFAHVCMFLHIQETRPTCQEKKKERNASGCSDKTRGQIHCFTGNKCNYAKSFQKNKSDIGDFEASGALLLDTFSVY